MEKKKSGSGKNTVFIIVVIVAGIIILGDIVGGFRIAKVFQRMFSSYTDNFQQSMDATDELTSPEVE